MHVIAIDGPAGAGKSTVARRVAVATGLPFLDTGAMYRCVALAAMRNGVDPADGDAVGHLANRVSIELSDAGVVLDGADVTDEIRDERVSATVSLIAVHSAVRAAMRDQQRAWVRVRDGGVVEGRDICTVVFPDAILKVFLTASPEVRARRRVDQVGGVVEEIAAAIAERDRIDSTRADSPLRPADDAVVIDSSTLDTDAVVSMIVDAYAARAGVRGG